MKIRLNDLGRRLRRKPSIALALGGGGSKGNAHLGVLRDLERQGIRVGAMAGTSMGGLVAAVYLAGNSVDDIETLFASLEQKALFRRGPDVRNAIMGLDGVTKMLGDTIGDMHFEDLSVPLGLTAVDLITGQEVVLTSGPLVEAVLATIALPGIFPTRLMNGYELVDGGLTNPVPVAVARSLAPHLPVVASVLTRPPEPQREIPLHKPMVSMPLLDRVSQFRLTQAWNVFTRAIGISGRHLAELRLSIEKPDVIIRPDVEHIGTMEAVDVYEVARLGEQATERAMPELRRVLANNRGFNSMLQRFRRHDPRPAPVRETD